MHSIQFPSLQSTVRCITLYNSFLYTSVITAFIHSYYLFSLTHTLDFFWPAISLRQSNQSDITPPDEESGAGQAWVSRHIAEEREGGWPSVLGGGECVCNDYPVWGVLVSCPAQPHLPARNSLAGEWSQIFEVYFQKVVRTNEIARSVIIT